MDKNKKAKNNQKQDKLAEALRKNIERRKKLQQITKK